MDRDSTAHEMIEVEDVPFGLEKSRIVPMTIEAYDGRITALEGIFNAEYMVPLTFQINIDDPDFLNDTINALNEFKNSLRGQMFRLPVETSTQTEHFTIVTTTDNVTPRGNLSIMMGDNYAFATLNVSFDISKDLSYGNQVHIYLAEYDVSTQTISNKVRAYPINPMVTRTNNPESFQNFNSPQVVNLIKDSEYVFTSSLFVKEDDLHFSLLEDVVKKPLLNKPYYLKMEFKRWNGMELTNAIVLEDLVTVVSGTASFSIGENIFMEIALAKFITDYVPSNIIDPEQPPIVMPTPSPQPTPTPPIGTPTPTPIIPSLFYAEQIGYSVIAYTGKDTQSFCGEQVGYSEISIQDYSSNIFSAEQEVYSALTYNHSNSLSFAGEQVGYSDIQIIGFVVKSFSGEQVAYSDIEFNSFTPQSFLGEQVGYSEILIDSFTTSKFFAEQEGYSTITYQDSTAQLIAPRFDGSQITQNTIQVEYTNTNGVSTEIEFIVTSDKEPNETNFEFSEWQRKDFTFSDLSGATSYTIQARFVPASGVTGFNNSEYTTVTRTTSTPPPPPPPPPQTATPSASFVSKTNTSLKFLLTNNDGDTVDISWQLYQGSTLIAGSWVETTISEEIEITGLTPDTTYTLTNVKAEATGKTPSGNASDIVVSTHKDPITVTFDVNGGTQSYSSVSGYPPLSVSNPGTPTRSGYTFKGWYVSGNKVTFPYTANSTLTMVADWELITITATFNSDGGSPTYAVQTGPPPLYVTNPGTPTKSGYAFLGWSPSLPTTISSNTTFTAVWVVAEGTYMYDDCIGVDLYSFYADGQGGTYHIPIEYNSTACGYIPPEPTPTPPPEPTPTPTPTPEPTPTNPYACLHEDTPIVMADGTTRLAKDVKVGDMLKGWYKDGMVDESDPDWIDWTTNSIDDGLHTHVEVKSAYPATYGMYYTINDDVKITPFHPFLVKKDNTWQWLDAPDIEVGDFLLGMNNNPIEITSITSHKETMKVMKIDVESVDTYFAGETPVLVHNEHDKGVL